MGARQPTTDQRVVHGAARAALIAAGVVVALSSFYVAPRLTSTKAQNGPVATQPGEVSEVTDAGPSSGPGQSVGANKVGSGVATPQPGAGGVPGVVPPGLSCPGKNGGQTDVGVDAKTIRLAATEVESGIGQSFLGPVRFGMLSVLKKTNRNGGICGRQLELALKDDGWLPDRGKLYIDNFIQSNQYFALAVVPSSEGLNAASSGGDLDHAGDPVAGGVGMPVIGSDGMLNSQYTDPWIWPVAASTATSMRIMAKDAHVRKGARKFAIVYDQNYRFGTEGAGAFVAQVRRDGDQVLDGCAIALTAGQSSYATEAKRFNDACSGTDFVALLLEPETAETWLRENPYRGYRPDGSGSGFAGPQPLFDKNFADTCGQTCQNMEVWTSFYPPLYPFDQRPEVRAFQSDLSSVDSNWQVDSQSAFTEGGYVGMELLVKALTDTSPFLTRQRLRTELDELTLNPGQTPGALTYKSGNHYANLIAVAFRDQYSSTASFQFVSSSQQQDPCSGCEDKPLS